MKQNLLKSIAMTVAMVAVSVTAQAQNVIRVRDRHVSAEQAAEMLTSQPQDTIVCAHRVDASTKDRKSLVVVFHKYYMEDGAIQTKEIRKNWFEVSTDELAFEQKRALVNGEHGAVDFSVMNPMGKNHDHYQVGVNGGIQYCAGAVAPLAQVNIEYHHRRLVFGVEANWTMNEYTTSADVEGKYSSIGLAAKVGYKFWFNRARKAYFTPSLHGGFSYQKTDSKESVVSSSNYAPYVRAQVEYGYFLAKNFCLKAGVYCQNGTSVQHNEWQNWRELAAGAFVGIAFTFR